jgi:hypothetical protein
MQFVESILKGTDLSFKTGEEDVLLYREAIARRLLTESGTYN